MTKEEFLLEWNGPQDWISAHTSGSTGTPKYIRLDKRLVISSAKRTIDFFNLDSTSRLHLCLSPDYIAGKMMIVRSLIAGCTLISEPAGNRPLKDFLGSSSPIDLIAVVPSQIPFMLENMEMLPPVRNMIVGGSKIPQETRERLLQSGLRAFETYGMTETASHVALRRISSGNPPFSALPGITFSLTPAGCLRIHSREFTIETTDCVQLLSDKEFRYLGRTDNAIISGGIKLHPEQLENRLSDRLKGYNYYISSHPDAKWGEIAVIVLEGIYSKEQTDSILCTARDVLGPIEAPKEAICLDRFEFTSSGKVKRRRFS